MASTRVSLYRQVLRNAAKAFAEAENDGEAEVVAEAGSILEDAAQKFADVADEEAVKLLERTELPKTVTAGKKRGRKPKRQALPDVSTNVHAVNGAASGEGEGASAEQ